MKKVVIVLALACFLFYIINMVSASINYSPVCKDSLLAWYNEDTGILATPLYHTLDNATANYTLYAEIMNMGSVPKNVEFDWYVCRCQNYLGNPLGICLDYFPFDIYNGGDAYGACIIAGSFNITLPGGHYERVNTSVSVQQYQGQLCGLFQADMRLRKVDGVFYDGLLTASLLGFCQDCPSPRCGDGHVDAGEECDDGNLIDNDGCNNNCTKDDRYKFCAQFTELYSCYHADYLNNEQDNPWPCDCYIRYVPQGYLMVPKCVPNKPENEKCSN